MVHLFSRLPRRKVPVDFENRVMSRVMESLQPQKVSLLQRFFQWQFIRPFRGFAPMAAATVFILALAFTVSFHFSGTGQGISAMVLVPGQTSEVTIASEGSSRTVTDKLAVNLDNALAVETGSESKAAIQFTGGSSFSAGAASAFKVRGEHIALSKGTFIADISDQRDTRFIDTPGALLEIVGTKVALKVLPGELTQVGVFSGKVMVHPVQGESFAMGVGQHFTVTPGGRILAMGKSSTSWMSALEREL